MEQKTSPNLEATPKAKAAFQKWYGKLHETDDAYVIPMLFRELEFMYQQGVYLAFLREKGIDAMAQPDLNYPTVWYCPVVKAGNNSLYDVDIEGDPDYNTAMIAAIEAGFARIEAA
jgi:hypothetical protein